MKPKRWSWIGACSTGSSHLKAGTGCQDFGACVEVPCFGGTALIAVISDGAGSAQFSAVGSRFVVGTMVRQFVRFVRAASATSIVSEELAREWLDDARDRISANAVAIDARPRDFAATLVAAVVLPSGITVCHVGDGACAARRQGEQNWQVASWPAHGEYASTTYFVTDDPEPNLRLTYWEGEFSDLAVFSDGLERLALDFANCTAFNPFFDPMSAPLTSLPPGRGRALSFKLRRFLDGPKVVERTDDDKTLIVAKRVAFQ
jgi:Protein phosphatase 2C